MIFSILNLYKKKLNYKYFKESTFAGLQPNVFEVIDEYLSFVELYPAPMSFVRTHVFTLLSHTFQVSLFF